MEEVLMASLAFLLGAACGALCWYQRDRRLLALYGDLVGQLTRTMRGGARYRLRQTSPAWTMPGVWEGKARRWTDKLN
jgi:hypothetical protein